jgi:glycosyltransferase involved in cell wall biosynthesis
MRCLLISKLFSPVFVADNAVPNSKRLRERKSTAPSPIRFATGASLDATREYRARRMSLYGSHEITMKQFGSNGSSELSQNSGTRPATVLPRRVVLLTNSIPPYRPPVFRALNRCLEHLRILLSIPIAAEKIREYGLEDVDIVVQKSFTRQYVSRSPQGFSEGIRTRFPYDTLAQLRRFKPDCIVTAEFGLRTILSCVYAAFRPKMRLVVWATVSEITELARGKGRGLIRKFILSRANAVLVNGSSGARYIEGIGFPRSEIYIVPQTADVAMFKGLPTRERKDRIELLCIAQLIERKGIMPFLTQLSAWAEDYPSQRVTFSLLGTGILSDVLKAQVTPPNLELRVLGHIDYAQVPAYCAAADIFVFPTLADEWGLVVNEAMAAGLPILGSLYSQAVEDLVEDGVTGWLFRPDKTEEMRAVIERALATPPELLDGMRQQVMKSIEGLTPEFMADRIVDGIAGIHPAPRNAPENYEVHG